MTRVLIAASQPDVRSALRLLLQDLEMEIAGEAADWSTAFRLTTENQPNMLLVDWELIPKNMTLAHLRTACRNTATIVLMSELDARQQAARSAGADLFISKGEMPDQVAIRLREAAARG